MKRILSILAALSLSTPVIADPEIKQWNTFHSMGCMLVRDCTDEVYKINKVEDILKYKPDMDLSEVGDELNDLILQFDRIGIGVYVAEGKYFPRGHRGVYHTVGNNFFLNLDYMGDPEVVLEVSRHEGWHAGQDCMAGTIENNNIAIIWKDGVVPNGYHIRANVAYAMTPEAVPWEKEALWAGETPYQTVDLLKACQADRPMWEIYEPTPLTREWLVDKGFIK